jgi:hypothetical protein
MCRLQAQVQADFLLEGMRTLERRHAIKLGKSCQTNRRKTQRQKRLNPLPWISAVSAAERLQVTFVGDAAEKSARTAISIMESALNVLGF